MCYGMEECTRCISSCSKKKISSNVANFISFQIEQLCSFVSWPICHQCENYFCYEHYKITILLRVQLRAWNGTVFTHRNDHLVTPQNKLQENRTHLISILGLMKEILPNFQWNPPRKMREGDDQTLKTSCCEITFWALTRFCNRHNTKNNIFYSLVFIFCLFRHKFLVLELQLVLRAA